MKPVEYYEGREQTYLKHFFLERYLERVAYAIGSFAPEFVYVDGFSGPWKSRDEAFEDTSFVIASETLRRVREGLKRIGKRPHLKCIFVEKNATSYRKLLRVAKSIPDIEIVVIQGKFEAKIPTILDLIGRSFSLVFVDPTGWTGFGLQQISPILRHQPGEVIINFMFDHINRFLDSDRPEIACSFDELFGGTGWGAAVAPGAHRSKAILGLYKERVRLIGSFKYVTSTRILKPLSDRAYFHLVYGTRNVRGLQVFSEVERHEVEEQERVRFDAQQKKRINRTGQRELFSADEGLAATSFNEERAEALTEAASTLRRLIQTNGRIEYSKALEILLEVPLVWEADVKRIILEMVSAKEIELAGLRPRERTPKPGHVLTYAGADDH